MTGFRSMRLALLLLVLPTLAPLFSQATELHKSAVCNGCEYQQYLESARYHAERPPISQHQRGGEAYSHVTIVDFSRREIRRFQVTYIGRVAYTPPPQHAPAPYFTIERISETQVPAPTLNEFSEWEHAVKAAEQKATNVPDSIADSAWDLVGAGHVQTAVADHFKQHTGIIHQVNLATSSLLATLGLMQGAEINIVFRFSDGSRAIYHLKGFDDEGDPILEFWKGHDADGNIVEDQESTFTGGSFVFHEGGYMAADSFRGASVRYGIDIPEPPQGTVEVGPINMACDPNAQVGDDDKCEW